MSDNLQSDGGSGGELLLGGRWTFGGALEGEEGGDRGTWRSFWGVRETRNELLCEWPRLALLAGISIASKPSAIFAKSKRASKVWPSKVKAPLESFRA